MGSDDEEVTMFEVWLGVGVISDVLEGRFVFLAAH